MYIFISFTILLHLQHCLAISTCWCCQGTFAPWLPLTAALSVYFLKHYGNICTVNRLCTASIQLNVLWPHIVAPSLIIGHPFIKVGKNWYDNPPKALDINTTGVLLTGWATARAIALMSNV